MMRKQGIDVQELDTSLDYWEAKAEVEAKYRTKLVLKMNKLEDKMLEDPPRKYVHCEVLANIMEMKATEERG